MPLRAPGKDESQQAYMSYCMRELADADTERPFTQRVAICLSAWRQRSSRGKFISLLGDALAKTLKDWRDQERVPAGVPEGGQFGSGTGTTGGTGPIESTQVLQPARNGNGRSRDGAVLPSPSSKPDLRSSLTHEGITNRNTATFDTNAIDARARQGIAAAAARDAADGMKSLQGSQGHPGLITTATRLKKDPEDTYIQHNAEREKQNPGNFERGMQKFRDAEIYPNYRPDDVKGSPDDIHKNVKEQMKSNLRFMASDEVNRVAGTNAADNRVWYAGARNIVDDRASRYSEPIQVGNKTVTLKDTSVAGVMAALSPQTDWDTNVTQGDQMIDIYSKRQNYKWDSGDTKMNAAWDKISKANPDFAEWKPMIHNKTLAEVQGDRMKGLWIRTYAEAHMEKVAYQVKPDGSFDRDKPMTLKWNNMVNMGNAVRAIESNGDPKVIVDALGSGHKVRSFYNNMLDPFSKNNDVTIDTHAVGVGLMRPLSSKDKAVDSGMDSRHYHIYADAVREVAREMGVQPRELQSMTWSAKRALWGDKAGKTIVAGLKPEFGDKATIRSAVDALWQKYQRGEASLEATQRAILRASEIAIKERKKEDDRWMDSTV